MWTLPVKKQLIFDVLIFVVVFAILLLLHTLGRPVLTGFWCHDLSLSYPYKPDTISQPLLMVVSFAAPFLVITTTESVRAAVNSQKSPSFRSELLTLVKTYIGFLFGMTINLIFTLVLKLCTGRLRPHFFDVCKPDFDKLNCTTDDGTDRFIMEYACTNTVVREKWIQDSRLSFPSGHASVAMFAATFIVFYLQLKIGVSFSSLLKMALQVCSMLVALFCCVTRVTDHKHFPTDVIAGCVIGVCLAWATFYKMGQWVVPSPPSDKLPRLHRATSIESEPQTPTPLLRPDRIVVEHHYTKDSIPGVKADFVHKI